MTTNSWAISGHSQDINWKTRYIWCVFLISIKTSCRNITAFQLFITCSSCQCEDEISSVLLLSGPDNWINQNPKPALLPAAKICGSSWSRAAWIMLSLPSKCFPLNLFSWGIFWKRCMVGQCPPTVHVAGISVVQHMDLCKLLSSTFAYLLFSVHSFGHWVTSSFFWNDRLSVTYLMLCQIPTVKPK